MAMTPDRPNPPAPSAVPQPPRLLDRVRATCRVRHYSIRYEIRTVQELLGHANVETTMIYTRVPNKGGRGVTSPLDRPG
jgi:integrase